MILQVRAVNRAGAGPWSDALEVVSGAGAPDPPSAPVAEVVKTSQARWLHFEFRGINSRTVSVWR